MSFIAGMDRGEVALLPAYLADHIAPDALVRAVDDFVGGLDLVGLGFERAISAATGRLGYHPGDMLRLSMGAYLDQVRSARLLERACQRDLEALRPMRPLTPDARTMAGSDMTTLRGSSPQAPRSCSSAGSTGCSAA